MKQFYEGQPNGYQESIEKGLRAIHGFQRYVGGSGSRKAQLQALAEVLRTSESVIIGAGAGLSTSAGLTYSGERFQRYFYDFAERFGISDIYSGGFYPFPDEETRWAWWRATFILTVTSSRRRQCIGSCFRFFGIKTTL